MKRFRNKEDALKEKQKNPLYRIKKERRGNRWEVFIPQRLKK